MFQKNGMKRKRKKNMKRKKFVFIIIVCFGGWWWVQDNVRIRKRGNKTTQDKRR